ncbi:effector-associated constant component EACC1 [Micromonospora sp. DT231]|uniref:effector-associated constant component EACC1 n=1 Tax=Micromonospora sp. DT231 TaxID=3416526 RepID=UPI003CEF1B15
MITLSVHPDRPSADARRSLASWLRAEDRLRDGVTSTPASQTPTGQTPAGEPSAGESPADGTDSLRVAVDDAGAAMVLVQAVAGWLVHRRDDVTVRLARPDGWTAEVDVHRARDMDQVTALIEAAVRALADRQPSAKTNDS